jgi:cytoskeletal protein CcmA (bactofilin family)
MTTVKGTLNVDEAVTLDNNLDVSGDTSVATFDSTGATSLATGGGAVNISKTGVMTTVKGTLNVDEAVTLDTTLNVAGVVTVTDATESTSASTGCMKLSGGLGVAKNIYCDGEITSASDASLKTNIINIDSPLEKIQQLNGVSFDWIRNGCSSYGVIAQDVEQALPNAVHDNDEHGTKTVNYNAVIGLLVEAIKEQNERYNTLEEQFKKFQ